jgi:hypothetical protein
MRSVWSDAEVRRAMTFVAESSAPRRLRRSCASPGTALQARSRRLGGSLRHWRRLIVASPAASRHAASPSRRFSITCRLVPRLHFDDSRLEIVGLATSIEG